MATLEHPMTTTGFCQHPSPGSHEYCRSLDRPCTCGCHTDPTPYSDEVLFGHRTDQPREEDT